MILPAAIRYQTEVATSIFAAKNAGVNIGNLGEQEMQLSDLAKTSHEMEKKIALLVAASDHHADGDSMAHAKYSKEQIIPAMNEVRKLGDKLEDRRRRSLASPHLSRNALHQVTAASASRRSSSMPEGPTRQGRPFFCYACHRRKNNVAP